MTRIKYDSDCFRTVSSHQKLYDQTILSIWQSVSLSVYPVCCQITLPVRTPTLYRTFFLLGSSPCGGVNLTGSLIFSRSLRGASGLISLSSDNSLLDRTHSEHCLKTNNDRACLNKTSPVTYRTLSKNNVVTC